MIIQINKIILRFSIMLVFLISCKYTADSRKEIKNMKIINYNEDIASVFSDVESDISL